ncbi:hypothetical protein R3P38DRAFT_2788467 [Favolaschia claudopus]|uniref:Uncharacterized protein n=1 Tax=Favolaschia claudopus TaxID=2862362 RepID=A0AAW0AK56_9AGAR
MAGRTIYVSTDSCTKASSFPYSLPSPSRSSTTESSQAQLYSVSGSHAGSEKSEKTGIGEEMTPRCGFVVSLGGGWGIGASAHRRSAIELSNARPVEELAGLEDVARRYAHPACRRNTYQGRTYAGIKMKTNSILILLYGYVVCLLILSPIDVTSTFPRGRRRRTRSRFDRSSFVVERRRLDMLRSEQILIE